MTKSRQTQKTTKALKIDSEPMQKQLAIEQAYKYFLKGLKAWEIAKLLDVSERTVQRWIAENEFKETAEPKSIKQKALELTLKGLSYQQTAKALKVSKGTIYNYIKEIREAKKET